MLVKTAIVGEANICDRCGHCHDEGTPCLAEESQEVEEAKEKKEGPND